MSWEPLAAADPVPGDAGAVEAAARALTDAADRLAQHRSALAGFDPTGIWRGYARSVFLEHRDGVVPVLEAVVARHDSAATALFRYAGELGAGQADARAALAVARTAETARRTALAGLRAMHDEQRLHQQMGEVPPPWTGPPWPDRLAEADADLARARAMLDAAVSRVADAATLATVALDAAASDDLDDGGFVATLLGRLAALGAERISGSDPATFVVGPDGLILNTRESWQWEAFEAAGIDPAAWDPSLGLAPNDRIIQDLYDYYGGLYLDHPELQWAGMAHLAGGVLYAGWQDIHAVRQLTSEVERREALRAMLGGGVPAWLTSQVAGFGDDELEFFEVTFQAMAQDVFLDMGWMHEAYRQGGIEAIRDLADAGELASPALADAWEDVASGDPDRVAAGNAALLDQEQAVVLQPSYDAIHQRNGPVGVAFTQVLGLVSESPVPGGRPFREVVTVPVGVSVGVDLPDSVPWAPLGPLGPTVDVPLPLPDRIGVDLEAELPFRNISVYEDRNEWLQEDMLPAGRDLFENRPQEAEDLMNTPTAELAEQFRLLGFLPYAP